MSKVLITRRLPASVLAAIPSGSLILHDSDEAIPRSTLLSELHKGGVSSIICMLSDTIDKEVLDAAGPTLKCVSTMSVGYSNVAVGECLSRGVRVGHTPGVLTDCTADLVLALTLATCRRVVEASAAVRSGDWKSWKPFWMCGSDIHHKTVGIVGLGRIGQAIARRFQGFDCPIRYTGKSGPKPREEAELGGKDIQWLPLPQLLSTCDIIVLIIPLTPDTHGLIGKKELAMMKDDAVLINAARGEVIVQDDLVEALRERPTLKAGLDVTSPEPLPPSHPLLSLLNCTVLPHIGSASMACREAMAALSVRNALQGMAGEAMDAECPESLDKFKASA